MSKTSVSSIQPSSVKLLQVTITFLSNDEMKAINF